MTTMDKLEELIYKGFKETDRKFLETDRKFQETDRKFLETDRKFQETDRKIKESFLETDRKFQETDRKFQETDRKLKESFQETDRKLKESFLEHDRILKETDKEIRKLGRALGKLGGKLGQFIENMVAPAVVRLFNEVGIPIADYSQRVYSPVRRIEFDIVAVNTDCVVVVSVKMTLEVEDVKEFLEERLPIFKELFPRYKHMKVIGAVAGANISGESDKYAMKRGLYVLVQSGKNINMLNDKDFKAKIF